MKQKSKRGSMQSSLERPGYRQQERGDRIISIASRREDHNDDVEPLSPKKDQVDPMQQQK
jgi:hypothetical protein